MKRFLHFAMSGAFLACAFSNSGPRAISQQSSAPSIVGRWRSLETSKGGIGTICEFRSGGTFDYSIGAVVEAPWRIENNQLILPPDTTDGAERKSPLKWIDANRLDLETEPKAIELTRVGDHSDVRNPLIGEWIGNTDLGGRNLEAHWLFYPRGKLVYLMPFTTQHGSYTMTGSAVHFKVQGESRDYHFKVDNDLLTLSARDSSQESHFVRY